MEMFFSHNEYPLINCLYFIIEIKKKRRVVLEFESHRVLLGMGSEVVISTHWSIDVVDINEHGIPC